MLTLSFVDDAHVETRRNLERRLARPARFAGNPVISMTEPWESLLCAYGSVLRDEGLYKAYYTMWWLDSAAPYDCRAEALAYAWSEDGVTWTKPALQIVGEVDGGRNNLIRYGMFADQPCVVRLAEARGPHRYAMAYYGDFAPLGAGVRICFSADGIRWEWPGSLVWRTAIDRVSSELDVYAADDTICFFFDRHIGRYVLLRKVMQAERLVHDPARDAGWSPRSETLRRRIARRESVDLERWNEPSVILEPDLEDPPSVDFHRLGATPCDDGYVGVLEAHDGTPGVDSIALHLVTSRDGITWTRPCRTQQPFVANGPDGAWDGGLVFATPSMITDGDQVRIYYGGMGARLRAESMAHCRRFGIGFATLQRERFCSLRALGGEPGLLITQPVDVRNGLHLNASATARGTVRAALFAAGDGGQIDGFSWEESDPFAGDRCDAPLTWRGSAAPAGRFRIGLRAADADLYAVYAA